MTGILMILSQGVSEVLPSLAALPVRVVAIFCLGAASAPAPPEAAGSTPALSEVAASTPASLKVAASTTEPPEVAAFTCELSVYPDMTTEVARELSVSSNTTMKVVPELRPLEVIFKS